jgi:uncharacterized protein involved in exopolysaccharide biosynthesis
MNQNSSGQFGSQEQINDPEISLLDVLIFLKRSYKLIALIGILGVAASCGYLLITPKQYQVSAQIQMAQISTTSGSLNPLGVNVEEPALLILRFSSPTSYTDEVSKLCGLDPAKDSKAILSQLVKMSTQKNLPTVVDLKITGTSPEASIACGQAILELIKTTQAQITKPYIEEAKLRLSQSQERINNIRDSIRIANDHTPVMGSYQPLTRDEYRSLLDETYFLKNYIASNENRGARLVAPFYVSDDPSVPKRRNVLLAGLVIGLFLGLLIAFVRQILPSLCAYLVNKTILK